MCVRTTCPSRCGRSSGTVGSFGANIVLLHTVSLQVCIIDANWIADAGSFRVWLLRLPPAGAACQLVPRRTEGVAATRFSLVSSIYPSESVLIIE